MALAANIEACEEEGAAEVAGVAEATGAEDSAGAGDAPGAADASGVADAAAVADASAVVDASGAEGATAGGAGAAADAAPPSSDAGAAGADGVATSAVGGIAAGDTPSAVVVVAKEGGDGAMGSVDCMKGGRVPLDHNDQDEELELQQYSVCTKQLRHARCCRSAQATDVTGEGRLKGKRWREGVGGAGLCGGW